MTGGASGDLLAAGAYSGGVTVFDARTREQLLLLEGHGGRGVTQVTFSRDGNFLYSGARRDAAIVCWDVRSTGAPLYRLQRDAAGTNQRLAFDIDPSGRHLAAGGQDGRVRVFDLTDGSQVGEFKAAGDAVNGVAFHPVMGLPLLATAGGERRFPLAPRDSDSDSESDDEPSSSARAATARSGGGGSGGGGGGAAARLGRSCNALRLWRLAFEYVDVELPACDVAGSAEAMEADVELAAADAAAAPVAAVDGGGGGGGGDSGAAVVAATAAAAAATAAADLSGLPVVRV